MTKQFDIPTIEALETSEYNYFHSPILVMRAADGKLYNHFAELCHVFGLNEVVETHHILKHTVLRKALRYAVINDQLPKVLFMQVGHLATWMMNLPLERIPDDQDKTELIALQENAAEYITEAFLSGQLTDMPFLSVLLTYDAPVVNSYLEARAVLGLARNQLILEGSRPSFTTSYPQKTDGQKAGI